MQDLAPRLPEKPEHNDAFGLLCYALYLWQYGFRLRYVGTELTFVERPQDFDPEVDAIDTTLSRLSKSHPGVLDDALLAPETLHHLHTTAPYPGKRPHCGNWIEQSPAGSLLAVMLQGASPREGQLLWRTLRTVDPVTVVRFVHQVCSSLPYSEHTMNYAMLQGEVVTWFGTEAFTKIQHALAGTLPPEKLDVLEVIASGQKRSDSPRLPDILPSDEVLCGWTAERIAECLADYRGWSVAELHRHLRAGKFLKGGEHVGEVILQDVDTLRSLGVTRHQLAEALRQAIRTEEVLKTMGWHQDPFHSDNTWNLSADVGGSCECIIHNPGLGERIYFGDMLPYLIRRACFFEGDVPFRLDPEKACRVLGLRKL